MGKIFKRGLIAVAPLAATLALILWLFHTLEGIFSKPIKAIIGDQYYFSGLGILVALVFILLTGIVINNWIIQKVSSWGEALVKKIPFIKTLYNSVGEMMSYFNSKDAQRQGAVVMVEVAGYRLIGLVTREDFNELPPGIGGSEDIAVYLPMSYQIGGYTVILPRSQVKRIDMTVEEGMRFAVTAGVLTRSKKSSEVTE